MRTDMFKVIVETRRRGAGYNRDGRAFRNSEDAPAKLGMRAGYRSRKWLNENLTPLERYLHSQVGRPWDKVYSEIRSTIDGRSTVKQHVLPHIEDFVLIHTKLVDGVVFSARGSWMRDGPIDKVDWRLYVHPRTGLLLENRGRMRTLRERQETARRKVLAGAADRRILDPGRQLHRIDGIWYEVEVAPLPAGRKVETTIGGQLRCKTIYETRWDALRRAVVSLQHAKQAPGNGQQSNQDLYGEPNLYGKSKRQLNSRELREYDLTGL